jgi:ligand-binding SRPBCC domain-containing protein
MKLYQHKFVVNAPISKVAEFHRNPDALKKLTPPPVFVQLHSAQKMSEGSMIDFTLWLGLLPLRWKAIYNDVQSMAGFTDRMLTGPYLEWEHQHRFAELNSNQTLVLDTVRATLGKHLLWGLISRLMWMSLPFLFAYRALQTRRILEG